MAVHEFGIMSEDPKKGERFDKYEPWKYGCIRVSDDYIEDIIEKFNDIYFYRHSVDIPGKGLNYCGITLIPPESIPAFLEVTRDIKGLESLNRLMTEAEKTKKFVIHYGL